MKGEGIGERVAQSAEWRMEVALAELRRVAYGDPGPPEEDTFLQYADEGPPKDVPLPGWKRSRWAKKLLSR